MLSANEMHKVCLQQFKKSDITIMSAAVADYRPAQTATQKIKKKGNNLSLELVKNPDILEDLGAKQANNL